MKEKIKAKDVAKALGVSTATVSLAVNGRPGVNEQTRRKILEYMGITDVEEEKGAEEPQKIRVIEIYDERPNWDNIDIARNAVCLEEARRIFQNAGFFMDIIYFYRNKDSIPRILQTFSDEKIAGVILNAAYAKKEEVEAFAKSDIPTVCCDHIFSGGNVDCVVMNNYEGVRKSLSYFCRKGHKEILYIKNGYSFFNLDERRRSFCEFMKQEGLAEHPEQYFLDLGKGVAEVQRNMTEYIKNGGYLPSALFMESYEVSIGTIRALESLGYHIPEDISVIGFDAIPEVALLDVDLTTVQYRYERNLHIASERLILRMQKEREERIQVFVDCELVEGNSVRQKLK